MIKISPGEEVRERYVLNILNVWERATADQELQGRSWYRVANGIASMMADGDTRMGAGLLAALSPQTSWWLNVELAADAYQTGRPARHVGDALSKANRILAGEDPAEVLPMQRKTGHFYRSILNPSDPSAICIDRHAHDIAVGRRFGYERRGLDARSRYELIADAYRSVALVLGEIPSTVQAVTWVAWRDKEN